MIARIVVVAFGTLLLFASTALGSDKTPLAMGATILRAVDLSQGFHVFNRGRTTKDDRRVFYEPVKVHGMRDSAGHVKVAFQSLYREGRPDASAPDVFKFSTTGDATVPTTRTPVPVGVVLANEYRVLGAVTVALAKFFERNPIGDYELDGYDENEVMVDVDVSVEKSLVLVDLRRSFEGVACLTFVVNEKNEIERIIRSR